MNRSEAEFKYRYLSSLISAAADQYTRTGKFSIYDLERQSEALKKHNYTPEAKVQAFADWVKEQENE